MNNSFWIWVILGTLLPTQIFANSLQDVEQGDAFFYIGQYKRAVHSYEKALKKDKKLGQKHPATIRDHRKLASAWFKINNFAKASKHFRNALAGARQKYRKGSPVVRVLRIRLAETLIKIKKYNVAIENLEDILEQDVKDLGWKHEQVAHDWRKLGDAWILAGNNKKALDYYEKALDSNIRQYGRSHIEVAARLSSVGQAWIKIGNHIKAVEYLEKAERIDLKILGERHPTVASDWNKLGIGWHYLGHYDKAISFFERSLENHLFNFGIEHDTVATDWRLLGYSWIKAEKFKRALDYLEKALKSDSKRYGKQHVNIAKDHEGIGEAWFHKGELNKASRHMTKAKQIYKTLLGELAPETVHAQERLDFFEGQRR